jgi:predicted NBD/HSP70 family sugar kinase
VEYDVAEDSVYTVGVDISRTYVQAAVMNLKMRVLEKHRFDMDGGMTPQKCAESLAGAVELMLANRSIDKKKILGLGVGTVGPMDRENGILLHPQGFPNDGWDDDIPLSDLLHAKTGIPCVIDNGANTAVLAEYLFGTGRGYGCVAYIHCGVGIRTAVIRDGMIFRTMNDNEDAFAHMTVDFNGELCRCGGRGCLENYVSLESVCQRYNTHTKKQIGYRELFSRAAGDDGAAVEALARSAKILGIGISNLAKLLNPGLVILSGPLVSNYEPFYKICVDAASERNGPDSGLAFSREGLFKEDVVAIGAGLMVLEQNFKQAGRME